MTKGKAKDKYTPEPLNFKDLIDVDPPPNHPVTENTIRVTKDWAKHPTKACDD